MLVPLPHPEVPDLRVVGTPLNLDGVRPTSLQPPPRLGEHTEEILGGAGLLGRGHWGADPARVVTTVAVESSARLVTERGTNCLRLPTLQQ